jgi:cytosine/adenosine deaminase-related metal-dependent hydrolase
VVITGARVAMNAGTAVGQDLWIHQGIISFKPIREAENAHLDLSGFLVLPGLINAHDHLEMNLLPRLGRGPYPNAYRWAEDIYHPEKPPVKQHLAIPKAVRFRWGAIKNLLSGVTTVGHHNNLHAVVRGEDFPLRVLQDFCWAHSIRFSPDWQRRAQTTPKDWPFIIHAAEGTDESAGNEIPAMAQAGALAESTVLVHGVGIVSRDLSMVAKRGASIVWCPSSNCFTLGRTLDAAVLNAGIPIALGSDSAMTAEGDLLDELRVARRSVSVDRLFEMVTSVPARIFKLPFGFGRICHGGPADLLVVDDDGTTPAESLLSKHPQLVLVKGRRVLLSASFAAKRPVEKDSGLFALHVEGRGPYWIAQNIPTLMSGAKRHLRDGLQLANRAVA